MRSRWLRCFLPLTLLASVSAVAQTTKPVVENDHLRVTHFEVAPGQILQTDNKYDQVTVQINDGESALLETGKLERTSSARAGDSHFFVAGSRRSIKNIGKHPISFVVVEFLRPQGKYVAFEVPPFHYCNPGSQKTCVTERYLFCTDRFCAESVSLDPGAMSTQHSHSSDYLVVAISGYTWRNEPVGKPAFDETFRKGDSMYVAAGGSHRLVNTGSTTAELFVVQFK